MTLPTGIAIYFIVWWVCLFVVLPFGVRNAHEEGVAVGEVVAPKLLKKVIATTVLSAVVFALIWGQMTYGWIGFADIPFLGNLIH